MHTLVLTDSRKHSALLNGIPITFDRKSIQEINMEFRSKSLIALFAAGSLFSGTAQAGQAGNVTVQFANGISCGGLTMSGSGFTIPIHLGAATIFNNNFFYMPMIFGRNNVTPAGFSYNAPILYQANFNMTQSTYQLIAPGVTNPVLNRTGTFTGSITGGGQLGGFNISLSLDCGVTLTGATIFTGA